VESIRILTDDSINIKPISDFEIFSRTIVNIIRNSVPKFTVGIYGEFGTGKSTLMKLIQKEFTDDRNVLTVWFNAWRYERQEQLAITALVKTIAYAMGEHAELRPIKRLLLKSMGAKDSGLIRNEEEDIDKDTIYYEGLKKVEREIIQLMESRPTFRIIIFVEDLDRCSAGKTIEVLESIKLFLGLMGFVYIVALDYKTIAKVITMAYKESGVNGEQYIKDLVQVPIMLPKHNIHDMSRLIDILTSNLDGNYSHIISENKDLIVKVLDPNPVEIIRFINRFIVTHAIYSLSSDVTAQQLLAVQGLNNKWNEFFKSFSSDKSFRLFSRKFLEMSMQERNSAFDDLEMTRHLPQSLENKILKFRGDNALWEFLAMSLSPLYSIKDWELYTRAVEAQ
jgi:hypothetical protein